VTDRASEATRDASAELLLAIVDDLFVRSRIDAAAGVAGVEVRYVSAAQEIGAAVAERPVRALLVGMAATRRPWPEIVRQARAEPATAGLYVLAFGPHKNLDLRAKALEAGVDRVVANSAFTRLLPTLLTTPSAPVGEDEE
jgi:PleD family two-component response regulator